MNELKNVVYQPASTHETFTAFYDGKLARVKSGSGEVLEAFAEVGDHSLTLKLPAHRSSLPVLVMIDYLLGHHESVQEMVIEGHATFSHLSRQQFFQIPDLWHRRGTFTFQPDQWTTTHGRLHPVRPRLVPGVQYRRYIPAIEKTLTFRSIEIDRDLEIFHEWHNQRRVSHLWDLNKPIEELKEYIARGLADSHQIPLILELDGESVGYFEVYWTADDRLAPYYDYSAYDRGFHFLIGNKKFLGEKNTNAALRAISHFMFLDDLRTQKLMAEPRSDNEKVLRYVQTLPGWTFIKEFDFPHKRSALLECRREVYFSENPL